MKKLIYLIAVIFLFASCEEVILGEEEANNPENNFEIFWKDFDEHYALFNVRGFDWGSIYNTYRPQINSQTTDDELWQIFKEMIAYLDDGHTFIYDPNTNKGFSSGSEEDEQVAKEFSLELVKSNYIENIKQVSNTDKFLYGKIKNKDIGYIYMKGFSTDFDKNAMDVVLSEIENHKAIILDIRNNTGGDDVAAQDIAGRFADGRHFVYTVQDKNGPNHDDFSDKREYYTEKRGSKNYNKPVIILTDKITVSAAEVFLLHMKAFEHVVQIGDVTAGDFSDTSMRRFLPNGWQYQYSIMMFLQPDGTSLDGVGHIPDIQIRNTETDIRNQEDKVLLRAIDYVESKN